MATAGDGAAPYEGGGAGGKFRTRPLRRSAQMTPYDRPPLALRNNNPSLFTKLVDPASRLIYAGAHRFFGVFRKRLPAAPPPRPSETNEEPRNRLQETVPNNCTGVLECTNNQDGNLAGVSTATEISDLEQLLKQKTFTRTEVERLTALLHSRTAESPTDDDDKMKAQNHGDERETAHAAISTPVFSSGVVEEDVASPAELAKAYMGTRSVKGSPSALSLSGSQRQIAALLNNTSVVPKTPIMSVAPKTANSFRGLENGFAAPISRGRSAIYSMARTPYSRVPSTFSQKNINSDYAHGAALTSATLSHSAWEHGGPSSSLSKMALKRRSSVLDDIGSGGPVRRTRQKSNLLSQGSFLSKHKREFGSSSSQQLEAANGKLLLMDEPEPKASKRAEENGETSIHRSGYASIPTKSTQMATKILQQLERLTPKEKSAGSRLAGMSEKSPTELTPSMLHGQARKSLEKLDSAKFLPSSQENKNSEDTYHPCLPGASESTSQSKDKVEENVPRKFAVPRNMLSSMNGDSTVPLRDSTPIVTSTDSTLKFVAEPPQKKRAFQMSAHEDSWELDDEIHSNGHMPIPAGENKKTETSVVENKAVSAEALPGIIKTSALPQTTKSLTLPEAAKIPLPQVSRTAELSEIVTTPAPSEVANTPSPSDVAKTAALPEVTKTPALVELTKPDDYVSPIEGDYGSSGGSIVGEQKVGFSLPNSSPSSRTIQSVVPSESSSLVDEVALQKDTSVFPSFGTNSKVAEKATVFPFSANQPSESKSNAGPTSIFNSVMKNDQVKFPMSNNDDDSNGQTAGNMFGKLEPLSSASPAVTSTSEVFQFGGCAKSSSTTNGTPASSPAMFSSTTPFSASGNNTNQLFNNASSNATSSVSTAATASTVTTVSSTVFSTTTSAPAFSFGSAVAPSTSGSMVTTASGAAVADAKTDKGPKFNSLSSSPFASTSFATASTGSSFFGFSSPAATSTTTDNQSQGSFFNIASGSQAVPFQFGSSATTIGSGTTGTSSSTLGTSPFGSLPPAFGSAASFGLSSAVASSETKSGSSATIGVFGSSWQPPKSSPFGSTFSSPATGFAFGASSTSMPSVSSSPIMFGSSNSGASTRSSMFSFTAAAATNSSFPAPSQAQSVFGSATPVFGGATTSPNNNDQMTMEDSMAEDSMQTPTPVPAFGQAPSPAAAPGFMFGSATPAPAPAPAPTLPFQFGSQPNQAPPQNPFHSSGSVEFNAGGSFSLGSGGGDKSGRRFVKVKSKNRRKENFK